MIVATDGTSPAPMVEFTWEREVPTPALIPGILVGSVLTILGFVLLALDVLARRKVRAVAAEAGVDDDVDAEEPTPADELEEIGRASCREGGARWGGAGVGEKTGASGGGAEGAQ